MENKHKEVGIKSLTITNLAQLLCAFAGGKLIQDVSGHHGNHKVTCHTGETFEVSSCHHQMLYPWDVEHEMLAWSTNKLSKVYQPANHYTTNNIAKEAFEEPEVVWFPEIKGFAIQCHPEWHQGYSGTAKDGVVFNKWIMEQIISYCFVKEVC